MASGLYVLSTIRPGSEVLTQALRSLFGSKGLAQAMDSDLSAVIAFGLELIGRWLSAPRVECLCSCPPPVDCSVTHTHTVKDTGVGIAWLLVAVLFAFLIGVGVGHYLRREPLRRFAPLPRQGAEDAVPAAGSDSATSRRPARGHLLLGR